ncbi:unnamed protein product [Moneuplotes crassus]|uniref:Aurora kinase n=1 Tax=Euplotes crassus TaxID=5936 RepID=A0AAD1U251_EUPCR|nr:unnamed protein product [Moneuplotes crassus]
MEYNNPFKNPFTKFSKAKSTLNNSSEESRPQSRLDKKVPKTGKKSKKGPSGIPSNQHNQYGGVKSRVFDFMGGPPRPATIKKSRNGVAVSQPPCKSVKKLTQQRLQELDHKDKKRESKTPNFRKNPQANPNFSKEERKSAQILDSSEKAHCGNSENLSGDNADVEQVIKHVDVERPQQDEGPMSKDCPLGQPLVHKPKDVEMEVDINVDSPRAIPSYTKPFETADFEPNQQIQDMEVSSLNQMSQTKKFGESHSDEDEGDWVDLLQGSDENLQDKENTENAQPNAQSTDKNHEERPKEDIEAERLFQKSVGEFKKGMEELKRKSEAKHSLKSSLKVPTENGVRGEGFNKNVKIKTPHKGTVSSPDDVPQVPRQTFCPEEWSLDNFEIGRPLSRGKFGHVLLVREKVTKYLFVLKMMFKSQLRKNPKYLKNFRREVEIHSRLDHPNIVKMCGWFQDKKRLFLILEFCAEGELFSYLYSQPQKRFTEDIAARYIKQMIEALIYLHSKNIIHRDIKPENILVDGEDIKLADFGWSIHTPKNRRNTFCGTLDYLPPEMVKAKDYDSRIDLWSIGVLTYELCSGSAPFHCKSDSKVYTKIKKAEYQLYSYFSQDLRNFIKRFLKADPDQRMSLEEALEHPWIVKNTGEQDGQGEAEMEL